MKALQRLLGRDLRVLGDQRRVGDVDDGQLVVEALGVGEAQVALALGLDPVRRQALGPEVERLSEPTRQTILCTIPAPARPGGAPGILEEGEVGAGVALLVGEEEVVDARVVLVDGFLHQPQSEHPGVEVDVALRVLGDRRDVVDSFKLHPVTYSIPLVSRGRRRTVKALVVLGRFSLFSASSRSGSSARRSTPTTGCRPARRAAADSTIRTALADYLADQLYENVDVEKDRRILPGDLKELAGPASGGLRQVAGQGAERLLQTSTAQSLWEEANRTAHEQLIAVLEDDKEAVSTDNGDVR